MRLENHMGGIGLATLAAGPMVVLTTLMAVIYSEFPKPISPDFGSIGLLAWAMLPATAIGIVVATPINLIGTVMMLWLAKSLPAVRLRIVWTLVGGLLGASAAWLLEGGSIMLFALTASSAFCAWLCHGGAPMDEVPTET